jgi:2-iminobutanoate/2-iminopropanoate deaminase
VTRDARQPKGIATPRFPYSPVVFAGEFVYTAGQVAHDETGTLVEGGIEEQTRRVLDNVGLCLAAVGCSMDDVVKVTAFLADLGDFEAFNGVYAERFSEPYPARSTVGVTLPAGLLVEIEVVARRSVP